MLEVQDLKAGYGPQEVLHGVSLHVDEGESVGLLGLNGAGKSTLISVLSGLHRATSGAVLVAGRDVTNAPSHAACRRTVGLVPETRELFTALSVEDNLRVALASTKLKRSALDDRIDEVTAPFPILRERHKQVAGLLSGGQQQMLAIARALTTRPRILLLDEPSLGLAPVLVAEIYERLNVMRDSGISMLIVEQHVKEVVGLCERMYVLELGRVTRAGSTEELLADEGFAKAYLGGESRTRDRTHEAEYRES